jgi:hypothetical protein
MRFNIFSRSLKSCYFIKDSIILVKKIDATSELIVFAQILYHQKK